jgi:hypothetical protein
MTTNSKVGLTLRDVLARDFWPALRRVSDACRLCGAKYQPGEEGSCTAASCASPPTGRSTRRKPHPEPAQREN